MDDLTPEAKAEIKAAIRIVREDTMDKYVREILAQHKPTPVDPPKDPPQDPPKPDGPNPPPVKDPPQDPPPPKRGLWWPPEDPE